MNKTLGMLLKGISLAMGIALIIVSILGTVSSNTGFAIVGVGIFAIALESFLKYTYGLHK